MSSYFGRTTTHYDNVLRTQNKSDIARSAYIQQLAATTTKNIFDTIIDTAEHTRDRKLTITFKKSYDSTPSIESFLVKCDGYDAIFSKDPLDSSEFNTVIEYAVTQLKEQGYSPKVVTDESITIEWPVPEHSTDEE